MSGQKLGHQVKSLEILVYTLEARLLTRFWWNLIRMFALTISRPVTNMGYVGSKTRSPDQVFGNSLEARLLTPFWWNLIRMFVKAISRPSSNMGHVGGHQVKSLKILVYTLDATFLTGFLWNIVRIFVLTISRPSLNMGHVGLKMRSPGQILGNSCLHSRGDICDPILMKPDQNVCLDTI